MYVANTPEIQSLAEQIKSGQHPQFIFSSEKRRVECRCGKHAVWHMTGFTCSSITARPCKY